MTVSRGARSGVALLAFGALSFFSSSSHVAPQAKAGGKAPRKARKTAAKTEGGDDKKNRKRKANTNSYASYIYKVLKQVHPDTGVSKKAMVIMDSFGTRFFHFFFGA